MPNRFTSTDLDLNFSAHPVSGDVSKLTGVNAVKKSLQNIVLMNAYEKPFHPEIAGNITNLLFELESPFIEVDIRERLEKLITNYEPRVRIRDIKTISNPEKNSLDLRIYFSIGIGDVVELTTVSLERIR